MNIKKCELFDINNPKPENIERCILVAIKNKREGNYKDFCFKKENDFISYLNALLNKNLIIKNQIILFPNEVNIADYSYCENHFFEINNRYKTIKYIKEHILDFISIGLSIASIIQK